MDVKNSRFSVATVLSFPQVSRNDGQLLHTVLCRKACCCSIRN